MCNFALGKIWLPHYLYSGSHSFPNTPKTSLHHLYTNSIPRLYQIYSTLGFPPSYLPFTKGVAKPHRWSGDGITMDQQGVMNLKLNRRYV